MTELLTALPRLFQWGRPFEYDLLIRESMSERLLERAMMKTNQQMTDAYRAVIPDRRESVAAPAN